MALQLLEDQKSGASGNYWRVIGFAVWDKNSKYAEAIICLYEDEARSTLAKTGQAEEVVKKKYAISGSDFDDLEVANLKLVDVDPYAVAYGVIEVHADFIGKKAVFGYDDVIYESDNIGIDNNGLGLVFDSNDIASVVVTAFNAANAGKEISIISPFFQPLALQIGLGNVILNC